MIVADTIAAISTSVGEAAISVVRLSGPESHAILGRAFLTRQPVSELSPRTTYLGRVVDAEKRVIDHALGILYRAPASYTGEDMVELHCHGGVLVTQKVLGVLLSHGARQADAGEFTQRAFLNGKMDLTQAEAVMDLIHAQSTLAMRAANEQLEGHIGKQADEMRTGLIGILAHVEAYIDFPDEDISPETGAALLARLDGLLNQTRKLLATSEHGRLLRQGARTVICGEPNVGKSSLLNLLAGFERAIVSPRAGTTRDTIEEFIQVHGIPLRLVDTAGLRESDDDIEQSGIERTTREMERADLILEVVDASQPADSSNRVVMTGQALQRRILVLNKSDCGQHPSWKRSGGYSISCQSGEGLEELRLAVRDLIARDGLLLGDHPIAINARHQSCFEKVSDCLNAARTSLMSGVAPEFTALDLREAVQALGEVVGQIDGEEVLDQIFRQFCIGK